MIAVGLVSVPKRASAQLAGLLACEPMAPFDWAALLSVSGRAAAVGTIGFNPQTGELQAINDGGVPRWVEYAFEDGVGATVTTLDPAVEFCEDCWAIDSESLLLVMQDIDDAMNMDPAGRYPEVGIDEFRREHLLT